MELTSCVMAYMSLIESFQKEVEEQHQKNLHWMKETRDEFMGYYLANVFTNPRVADVLMSSIQLLEEKINESRKPSNGKSSQVSHTITW